ncbi:MAG TPA: cbb3-type cytochrome c oxidase subunit I, partial [Bacillota bacterium]
TTGARPLHEGLSRVAFLLYILFIQLGSIHHLLVDPGLGATNRIMNTSYFMYMAVLGSLIHAFSIPSAVEAAQRARGQNRGLFGWLRRAPWREPGFSSLALSFVVFGFLAGVTGVIMGVPQLDMLVHNTLYVPGHFHLTVVSGTTVAFMGIAYYLVPLIARRQLVGGRMARWQPYVFSLGLLLMTGGMLLAGQMGVPRRVWDITYDLAPLATGVFQTPAVQLALGLFGIGALVAVAGGAMFVAVMVGTLWMGKATDRPAVFVQAPALPAAMGGSQLADPTPGEHGLRAPGTLALVFTFLAWFVLAYIAAWHNLAGSWGVR